MEVDQQTVEGFRVMAAYIEETIEREEHALEEPPDEEREHFAARHRWRWRERGLQAVNTQIDQLEVDVFARDVLGNLKQL